MGVAEGLVEILGLPPEERVTAYAIDAQEAQWRAARMRVGEGEAFGYDRGLGPELYDVVTDPQTQNNLIDSDPAKARELAGQLAGLRQVVDAGGVV